MKTITKKELSLITDGLLTLKKEYQKELDHATARKAWELYQDLLRVKSVVVTYK